MEISSPLDERSTALQQPADTVPWVYSNIGSDGAKALAEGLQHCDNLQTLHLDQNNIGADGAKALAEHCNNLQTLHLEWNGIGAHGAKALAEGLQHCNNLQTLHLNHNRIGDDGAKALAEGLQYCNNLRTLDLEWNDIGDDGAKALAEGLQHCNNLQTLHLKENGMVPRPLLRVYSIATTCKHCILIIIDGDKALAVGLPPKETLSWMLRGSTLLPAWSSRISIS